MGFQNRHNFFLQYFKPYIKYLNEPDLKKLPPRYNLNGSINDRNTFNTTGYSFNLADGSQVIFNNNGDAILMWAAIDVNGFQRPNKIGCDTFLFMISPKYGFIPLGDKGTSLSVYLFPEDDKRNSILLGKSDFACNSAKMSYWCSALIMLDGWQIKDDCPW